MGSVGRELQEAKCRAVPQGAQDVPDGVEQTGQGDGEDL